MPLPLSADKIASYAIRGPNPSPISLAIEHSQAVHRIDLINAWAPAIGPGTRVLELGCGQGTCTQALAEAVSSSNPPTTPNGHITAIDPGAPDYGAPFTLAQAQAHLSTGPLRGLLTFHRADPLTFLAAHPHVTWDVAVLAHCIWYFRSPETLGEILAALRGRVARVCLAEWALHATEPAAAAHVLAALARAGLEAQRRGGSDENIQMVVGPGWVKGVVAGAGRGPSWLAQFVAPHGWEEPHSSPHAFRVPLLLIIGGTSFLEATGETRLQPGSTMIRLEVGRSTKEPGHFSAVNDHGTQLLAEEQLNDVSGLDSHQIGIAQRLSHGGRVGGQEVVQFIALPQGILGQEVVKLPELSIDEGTPLICQPGNLFLGLPEVPLQVQFELQARHNSAVPCYLSNHGIPPSH
ncbi:hypothetical protein CHGG_03631 [Chaetomium globosum CBS 148.51]|uniref:Methyltransferase domain-containing protein n=1 Tax=Chaetomium globosum (strain ATCC 6205 / CBS 148.51 / DSM 1962 / NBRC 6347 / NRRL 1970) TaxID=306901 RepID=Q2H823_CHAGB|nr:uncharacterized protein CHGG_03631 [Chaetomium globosum CBS 148.51]EAQ91696.1 hypothetical protein CHGG_03631 [Chaetomium globosum CBS 148.51]